jgi:hypothetical protein
LPRVHFPASAAVRSRHGTIGHLGLLGLIIVARLRRDDEPAVGSCAAKMPAQAGSSSSVMIRSARRLSGWGPRSGSRQPLHTAAWVSVALRGPSARCAWDSRQPNGSVHELDARRPLQYTGVFTIPSSSKRREPPRCRAGYRSPGTTPWRRRRRGARALRAGVRSEVGVAKPPIEGRRRQGLGDLQAIEHAPDHLGRALLQAPSRRRYVRRGYCALRARSRGSGARRSASAGASSGGRRRTRAQTSGRP